MKALPVVVGPRAEAQMDQAFAWWASQRSLEQADRWFRGILAAIDEIPENPLRYAKHSESDRFPFEVRETLFGVGRRPTHRVLFTIRPDCVYVLSILHVAQDAIGLEDL